MIRDQRNRSPVKWPTIHRALVVSRFFLPSYNAQHLHDKDNLIAWLKYAIDVFEIEGVIENDRHLHWKSPEQIVHRRPHVKIALFPFNDEANKVLDRAFESIKEGCKSDAEFAWLATVLDPRSVWGE